MDEPSRLLRKLERNNSDPDVVMEKYVWCIVDCESLSRTKLSDIELSAARQILEDYGKIIEKLSLNKISWDEKKCTTDGPLNLHAVLTKYCTNVGVLKVAGPFASVKLLNSPRALNLPNLREIYFSCGQFETDRETDRNDAIYAIYSEIFKGATCLEKLDYTFFDLKEADQILKALKDATDTTPLKCFRKLKLLSNSSVFKESQLMDLSSIKIPNLKHLEIGNGLWEDVKSSTFVKVLTSFPKLQTLIIHGSLQGNLSIDSNLYVHFPYMSKLATLSIGAEYEFQSVIQKPYTRNIVTISDSAVEFLKFQIRLPQMPSLETIALGSLVNIDQLSFKDLPNLKVFKVGGPWNQTCNFLREEPHLKVTDLQFPDALKDSSLSRRIPQMFPSLKRLWIFLPSVVSLRGFFEAMVDANNVKIEELYIKTQFDFESTLESCLLGRSTASTRSDRDKNNLNMLKEYCHFMDYVKYYNIELPIIKDDEEDEEITSPGIGVLKSLRVLRMEHIPRVLRIPKGKYHWLDHRASFTHDTIGFLKYRLSQKCINELPINNLESCTWPNFEVSSIRHVLLLVA